MNKRLRFHAMAISAICAVIMVVFAIATPEPTSAPVATEQTSNRIEIYQASWGVNCNADIARAIKARQSMPQPKDETGKPIPYDPLTPAQVNNVLQPVGDACNGRVACQIEATSTRLSANPMETCYKVLDVQYRCFTYDRLQQAHADQGALLTIDCHEKPSTPAQAAPVAAQ